jgi:hypothetical protein
VICVCVAHFFRSKINCVGRHKSHSRLKKTYIGYINRIQQKNIGYFFIFFSGEIPHHPPPDLTNNSTPPTLLSVVETMRFSHSLLLLYLAHQQDKKKTVLKKRKQSCYRKDFFLSLSIEERQQQYRKIPCCALTPLVLSPWQKLLKSRNDQGYTTMVGFNCKSFDKILKNFGPIFSSHTPFDESGFIVPFKYVRGQKRNVQLEDCLGGISMDANQRGVKCFAACFWTHLY